MLFKNILGKLHTSLYGRMSLVNLANLDSVKFKSFLDSFDNVLCDCDGVVWHMGTPISNVNKSISKLKQLRKKVYYVTNNSYLSLKDICDSLRNGKLDVEVQDITNPRLVVLNYLKKINFTGGICILASPSFKKEFKDAGFNVVDLEQPDMETLNIRAGSFLEEVRTGTDKIKAVVFDFDFTLSYFKLLKLTLCLQNPDVLFLVACSDRIFPMGVDAVGIGPHYLVRPIRDITRREPLLFGKPATHFNDFLVEKLQINNPSRTLFIGDSLDTDIEFATKCGYQSLLTLTGNTKLEQIDSTTNLAKIPNYYIKSLGDLHQLIEANLKL